MKIIGETTEGFILEATKDEIANLKDLYSKYDLKQENSVKVGDRIEIKKIYDRYRGFEGLIKGSDFNNALLRLKDTIEVLTPVQELFNQTKEILK